MDDAIEAAVEFESGAVGTIESTRLGLMPLHLLRADDGIRTRDPHLGKVMRYQLRYIRAPRTTRRPSRRTTIVHQSVAAQISTILAPGEVRTADTPAVKSRTR